MSIFAGQANWLGEESYPDVFAGANLSAQGGPLTIYVVPTDDQGLVDAIAALNTNGLPVSYVDVTQSYAQLEALTKSIPLAFDGATFSYWGPDWQTNSVTVSAEAPTAAGIRTLQAHEPGLAVTKVNYFSVVQGLLRARFGPKVSVIAATGRKAVAVSGIRWDDGQFQEVGDLLGESLSIGGPGSNQALGCSTNFAWYYTLHTSWVYYGTAGHCGSGNWYNDQGWSSNYKVGTTSTVYYNNSPNFDDFQSVAVAAHNPWNDIFYGGFNGVHPVNGTTAVPGGGSAQDTYDGSFTDEVVGNPVEVTGQCAGVWNGFLGEDVKTCDLSFTDLNANGQNPTQSGDSGGPVYQRESGTSDVKAVGVIVANAPGPYTGGAYEAIGQIEADSSLAITTCGC